MVDFAEEETDIAHIAQLVLLVARQIQHLEFTDGEAISLTPMESVMLSYIHQATDRSGGEGICAGAIGADLHMKSSNVSTTLRTLDEKELIGRSADPQDARRSLIHPTALARENFLVLQDVWRRRLSALISDPSQLDAAQSVLEQLQVGLEHQR